MIWAVYLEIPLSNLWLWCPWRADNQSGILTIVAARAVSMEPLLQAKYTYRSLMTRSVFYLSSLCCLRSKARQLMAGEGEGGGGVRGAPDAFISCFNPPWHLSLISCQRRYDMPDYNSPASLEAHADNWNCFCIVREFQSFQWKVCSSILFPWGSFPRFSTLITLTSSEHSNLCSVHTLNLNLWVSQIQWKFTEFQSI